MDDEAKEAWAKLKDANKLAADAKEAFKLAREEVKRCEENFRVLMDDAEAGQQRLPLGGGK